jgi:hypothetical protein
MRKISFSLLVSVIIALALAISSGPSSYAQPMLRQDESPSPPPTFSCCEHDIKVHRVTATPRNTGQAPGTITVTIDFQLDLGWGCDPDATKDCFAFYNIVQELSDWEELVGGVWTDIPAANVRETVITDPPIQTRCDGKHHKGTWSYAYIATVTTTNPIRNSSLIFDWDIPAIKGTSYHAEYQVTGISPTTGTRPPTVRGPHPKKK